MLYIAMIAAAMFAAYGLLRYWQYSSGYMAAAYKQAKMDGRSLLRRLVASVLFTAIIIVGIPVFMIFLPFIQGLEELTRDQVLQDTSIYCAVVGLALYGFAFLLKRFRDRINYNIMQVEVFHKKGGDS